MNVNVAIDVLAGGVKAFSPGDLGATVSRWWNETVSVSTWTDDKGNANYTQGTGANQPSVTTINGHPALHFNGAAPSFMSGGGSNQTQYNGALTVWSVIKLSALTTAGGAGGALPGNRSFGALGLSFGGDWTANNGKITLGHSITTAGKFARSDAAVNDNAIHRVIGTWDGTTYKLYIDGTLQATTGTDTTAIGAPTDNLTVGQGGGGGGVVTGDIGNSGACFTTCLAGSISDPSSDLGKLDLYLKKWAGQ